MALDSEVGRPLTLSYSTAEKPSLNVVFDRESRTFTRTLNGKIETYTFEPFTNGVPPAIPYDAHILYAFVTDFNRIAKTVTLRLSRESLLSLTPDMKEALIPGPADLILCLGQEVFPLNKTFRGVQRRNKIVRGSEEIIDRFGISG